MRLLLDKCDPPKKYGSTLWCITTRRNTWWTRPFHAQYHSMHNGSAAELDGSSEETQPFNGEICSESRVKGWWSDNQLPGMENQGKSWKNRLVNVVWWLILCRYPVAFFADRWVQFFRYPSRRIFQYSKLSITPQDRNVRNVSACISGLITPGWSPDYVAIFFLSLSCLSTIFLKVRNTKQQKSNDIHVTESQNHKTDWRKTVQRHVKTYDIFVKNLSLHHWARHPSPLTIPWQQSWTLWKLCRFGRYEKHQSHDKKGLQHRQIGVLGLDWKRHLSWVKMLSAHWICEMDWVVLSDQLFRTGHIQLILPFA